jgi:polysaccharide biosynthesis transport protein
MRPDEKALMNPQPTGLDLQQTLSFLRRRVLLILLCTILAGGLTYGLSKRETKKYTATAAVSFNSNPLSQQIVGFSSSAGSSNNSVLAQEDSDLELVRLGNMARETAILLGHGLTTEGVRSSLSISTRGESNVVEVAATSTSPGLAAAIANTYVKRFVKEQQSSNRQFFKSALALVTSQLSRLPPAQRFGADGLDLEERAHTLSLLAELGYNNAQIAQLSAIPSSPSSPKTSRNTGLGIVLGILLGLGIAIMLERLDHRLKRPEDLEHLYGLPRVGEVPRSAALARSARGDASDRPLPPAEDEAFSLIRAHLRFHKDAQNDRNVRTVMIASPEPGDGKTTIARHLAEAGAKAGSRVLLVEADLRRPSIAQQLHIQAGPGLADVLRGTFQLTEAIQSVVTATTGHTLDVLTAGAALPSHPNELFERPTMDALLNRIRTAYDLVVIDSPPLCVVSDAFSLLTKVDGVLIVGRIRHSREDGAKELQKALVGSHAPLLGVIANGTRPSRYKPYGATGYNNPSRLTSKDDAASSESFLPAASA